MAKVSGNAGVARGAKEGLLRGGWYVNAVAVAIKLADAEVDKVEL